MLAWQIFGVHITTINNATILGSVRLVRIGSFHLIKTIQISEPFQPEIDPGTRSRVTERALKLIDGELCQRVGNAMDLDVIGSRDQGERAIDQCAGRNVLGAARRRETRHGRRTRGALSLVHADARSLLAPWSPRVHARGMLAGSKAGVARAQCRCGAVPALPACVRHERCLWSGGVGY
jgi:hypothetical protein